MSKLPSILLIGILLWREYTRPKLIEPTAKASDFDPEMIRIGKLIEKEHTNDPKIALKIALHHLSEDEKYYDKAMFKKELEKEK